MNRSVFYELALCLAVGGDFVNESIGAVVLDLGDFDLGCCGLTESADGQGDLVIFGVDSGDLCLDDVADGKNLFGLADAAVCDLRNVDQTVNAGQDLCESAEGHELYDLDLCGIADIVVSGELDPGILVGILVAKGDLALFLIEADDIDIDLSPILKTSSGFLMRLQDISET